MSGNEQQNQGSLELGLFINKQYVTVKKLGVGGFGIVWQAYDFSLRNFIAIISIVSIAMKKTISKTTKKIV